MERAYTRSLLEAYFSSKGNEWKTKKGSDEKVTEVMLISGQWDLLIRLKYSNIEELSNFVVSQLRKEKGVGRTDTTIVLNKVK